MHALRLLPASLVLAFGLSACGGSGDSTSSPTTPTTPAASASSGVLVDDLVVGATVFCDDNGNGALDGGELSAVTDSLGAYAFSAACSGRLASVAGTGYDLTTLKAPPGQFIAAAGSMVVSPFTTMKVVSGLSDAEFQTVLERLGLSGVDVATFDPTKDSTRATTAAAIAKILVDIAELSADTGGNPAAAFRGAVAAVAEQVRGSGASVFASDSGLQTLVQAAALGGLREGNKGRDTLDETALANAAQLAAQGLAAIAQQTRSAASLSAARDLISSNAVRTLISQVDLKDSTQVAAARTRLADTSALTAAQYVFVTGDQVQIAPVSGQLTTATLAQFQSGLTLSGQTLATLDYVKLPIDATRLAIPKKGAGLTLGIEIENTTTGGILQARLSGVTLLRDETDRVRAQIESDAGLHLYMKTGAGIEIGTGATPFADLSSNILCSCSDGVGIDLQKLAAGLRKRFPDNTTLIDRVLTETGTFRVRMVGTGADLRQADGTRLGVSRITVRTPGSTATAAEVGGVSIQGRVTF